MNGEQLRTIYLSARLLKTCGSSNVNTINTRNNIHRIFFKHTRKKYNYVNNSQQEVFFIPSVIIFALAYPILGKYKFVITIFFRCPTSEITHWTNHTRSAWRSMNIEFFASIFHNLSFGLLYWWWVDGLSYSAAIQRQTTVTDYSSKSEKNIVTLPIVINYTPVSLTGKKIVH